MLGRYRHTLAYLQSRDCASRLNNFYGVQEVTIALEFVIVDLQTAHMFML